MPRLEFPQLSSRGPQTQIPIILGTTISITPVELDFAGRPICKFNRCVVKYVSSETAGYHNTTRLFLIENFETKDVKKNLKSPSATVVIKTTRVHGWKSVSDTAWTHAGWFAQWTNSSICHGSCYNRPLISSYWERLDLEIEVQYFVHGWGVFWENLKRIQV